MVSVKHNCSECESKYTIQYDEINCEDNPTFCSFCGTYIQESEIEQDEDY